MSDGESEIATVPLIVHEQSMNRLRGALWSVAVGWAVSVVSMAVVLWLVAI